MNSRTFMHLDEAAAARYFARNVNWDATVSEIEILERRIEWMQKKMDRDYAALAASQAALSDKVYTVHHALWDKIDERYDRLSKRQEALRDKIDGVDQRLSEKIEAAHGSR